MSDMTKNDMAYIQLEKELKLLNLQYNELYAAFRVVGSTTMNGTLDVRDVFDLSKPSHPLLKNIIPAIEDLQLYCHDLYAAWKKVQKRQTIVRGLIDAYHRGENLIQARLSLEEDDD